MSSKVNGTMPDSTGLAAVPNGVPKIKTHTKEPEKNATIPPRNVCVDDSGPTVKAQTLDELHSLQKKKSAPTTPKSSKAGALQMSEEERQRLQLKSISFGYFSSVFITVFGPKVIKGGPSKKTHEVKVPHPIAEPKPEFKNVSDSALKFTHVLYDLSPAAELYEQAIKYEKGSFITSTGALATLSGAKTGRSPRDKRVVKEETSEKDLWWGKERAVDYINSLDKVYVNDQGQDYLGSCVSCTLHVQYVYPTYP
ncbi:hypothetical protein L7F22_015330 [Adiantum nelumboides]|nr:hypothetical protein [Adiantum nelumboides]